MLSSVLVILLTIAGSNNVLVAANYKYYSFRNSRLIAIPGSDSYGLASPYPSKIMATGVQGRVKKVSITLHGVNHTFPADVDILLVGPTKANVLLMSDAGASIGINYATLTFDQNATSSLTRHTEIVTGTYKPTDYAYGENSSDFFPNCGITNFGSTLNAFNNVNANGVWSLYIYDDELSDVGQITSGWSLSITTKITTLSPSVSPSVSYDPSSKPSADATYYSFSNSESIDIPASDIDGSTITVNAVQGMVVKVTVVLNGISHDFADDVDILLVGPTQENVILMSDVGGYSSLNSVTLTFDQTALISLPDSDQITTGTYLPSDREADSFSNFSNSGSTLDVFNGLDANGNWTLYVFDDYPELDGGQITSGWSLFITTELTSTTSVNPSVNPSVSPSVSYNPSVNSDPSSKPSANLSIPMDQNA